MYADGTVALNLGYRSARPSRGATPAALNDGSGANTGAEHRLQHRLLRLRRRRLVQPEQHSSTASHPGRHQRRRADRPGLRRQRRSRSPSTPATGSTAPVAFHGSLSAAQRRPNATLGGGVYFTFPHLLHRRVCIVINPGADVSAGVSRSEQALRDINGDGFADHLASTSDNQLTVAENNTGTTNLLRTVTRPLGGADGLRLHAATATPTASRSRAGCCRGCRSTTATPATAPDVQLTTVRVHRRRVRPPGARVPRLRHGGRERQRRPGNGDAVYRSRHRELPHRQHYTRGLLRKRDHRRRGRAPVHRDRQHLHPARRRRPDAPPTRTAPRRRSSRSSARTDQRFFEGQADAGQDHVHHHGATTRSATSPTRVRRRRCRRRATTCDARRQLHHGDPACQASDIVGAATAHRRVRRRRADAPPGVHSRLRDRERHPGPGGLADGAGRRSPTWRTRPTATCKSVIGPAEQDRPAVPAGLHLRRRPSDTHVASVTDSFGYHSTTTYDPRFGAGRHDHRREQPGGHATPTTRSAGWSRSTGPYEIPRTGPRSTFEYHPEAAVPVRGHPPRRPAGRRHGADRHHRHHHLHRRAGADHRRPRRTPPCRTGPTPRRWT